MPSRKAKAPPAPGARPTRPAAEAPDRRRAVLEAALESFSEAGFDATSIADIARRAGVGHPLVHYHFESKEALWDATMAFAFADLNHALAGIDLLADQLRPTEALRLFCHAFAKFCVENPRHLDLIMSESRRLTPRSERFLASFVNPIHQRLALIIQRAVAEKEIKPVEPAHLIALLMGSLMHFVGACEIFKTIYGIRTDDPKVVAAHTSVIFELAMGSLREPASHDPTGSASS